MNLIEPCQVCGKPMKKTGSNQKSHKECKRPIASRYVPVKDRVKDGYIDCVPQMF